MGYVEGRELLESQISYLQAGKSWNPTPVV